MHRDVWGEARLTMQLQSIYFKKATTKTILILVKGGYGVIWPRGRVGGGRVEEDGGGGERGR